MISFIVIGKNEGWKLRKCLQSIHDVILSDKITDYEIIYVDSQSTDGSIDLAFSFDNVKVFKITGKCNAAIGRNIGAGESKGDILFFIDGDMEVRSGFIPLICEDDRLKYPFVSGLLDEYLYDKDWRFIRKYDRLRQRYGTGDKYSHTVGGVFIIEKEKWELLGGMDNRLTVNEDNDLGLRMSDRGLPILIKSDYIVNHHMISYLQRGITLFVRGGKYSALTARKNFFRPVYWKALLRSQYSSYLLMMSIPLIFISPYLMLPYIMVISFRSFFAKMSKHNSRTKVLFYRAARDITFVSCFFFWFPSGAREQYIEVK